MSKSKIKIPGEPTPKAAISETETAASAKPYDPFDFRGGPPTQMLAARCWGGLTLFS